VLVCWICVNQWPTISSSLPSRLDRDLMKSRAQPKRDIDLPRCAGSIQPLPGQARAYLEFRHDMTSLMPPSPSSSSQELRKSSVCLPLVRGSHSIARKIVPATVSLWELSGDAECQMNNSVEEGLTYTCPEVHSTGGG
jgi:hypothetical protein